MLAWRNVRYTDFTYFRTIACGHTLYLFVEQLLNFICDTLTRNPKINHC